MQRIRLVVAMSLDGYIAGPNGEADWIIADPEIDFGELWAQFDTLLMGRRTYEAARARLGPSAMQGMKVVVVSRTLKPEDAPGIRVISELSRDGLQALRTDSTKDIWLMGGGKLFSSVLSLGEVDSVEVSTVPVLLGAGVLLLPEVAQRVGLRFVDHRVYPSGIVSLTYDVLH